jgi:hypothetical protein
MLAIAAPKRRRALIAFAMAALAALAVVGIAIFQARSPAPATTSHGEEPASQASTVEVDGNTYYLSVGRGFLITASDLSVYSTDAKANDGRAIGHTAYALRGVDPAKFLAMPSASDAADALGPFPPYMVLMSASLVSGPSPRIDLGPMCPFADPAATSPVPGC